ncbi:MOSC N-terminal beta barrel domain-containing protein [Massilia terrae]|uniref:MOSC N-terminal beta barrel domain-containing protein n=1 Tax=Massilia terrae TaxID=1811224 RepID=A0ABT2CXW4_9BURK|nr:MOSC N-terminal beta barrel domain-containing protein [Massilia terrae]MCS0658645.1 MOSC N-terminal beta barrel domain-containing protein [Massilia terrae]
MAILTELVLYPIKSCAGMPVDAATVTSAGLSAHGIHDREWMLVTEDGQFLTQREHPRMARIVPRPEGGALVVQGPGMAPLALPLDAEDGAPRMVRIWDDVVPAADCGDQAAAWFSAVLDSPCRLVRFRRDVVRPTSTKWTGGVPADTRFADGYPLLLIGAASLADLNRRLAAAGRAPLPMDRFRPNLVVDGIDAYEEDFLASLAADGLVLKPVKPCARCPIPSIDQATGSAGPDPLDIMLSYRANPRMDGAVCFGMNCIVVAGAPAVLRRGQPIDTSIAF